MTYPEFAKSRPVLFGQIVCNGKVKIGEFRPSWNRWSNSATYQYFTPKGKKGAGGFTLQRAFKLFSTGQLTTNPEHGKPENYL